MIFFYNLNGDLIKYIPEKIYQGSNRANRIWLFAPIVESLVTVCYKLPNGKVLPEVNLTRQQEVNELKFNDEDVSVWFIDIPSSVTSYAGDVDVQFFIRPIGGEQAYRIATQIVTFSVLEGIAPKIEPPITDSYEELLDYIASIQFAKDLNITNGKGVGSLKQTNILASAIVEGLKKYTCAYIIASSKYDETINSNHIKEVIETYENEYDMLDIIANRMFAGDLTKASNFVDSMIFSEMGIDSVEENKVDIAGAVAFGINNYINAVGGVAIGSDNEITETAPNGVAIGVGLEVGGQNAFVQGKSSVFKEREGNAQSKRFIDNLINAGLLGYGNKEYKLGKALGIKSASFNGSNAIGEKSFAAGGSVASGTNAVALGNQNISKGNSSFTAGMSNYVKSYAGIALGYNNTVSGGSAFATNYGNIAGYTNQAVVSPSFFKLSTSVTTF